MSEKPDTTVHHFMQGNRRWRWITFGVVSGLGMLQAVAFVVLHSKIEHIQRNTDEALHVSNDAQENVKKLESEIDSQSFDTALVRNRNESFLFPTDAMFRLLPDEAY